LGRNCFLNHIIEGNIEGMIKVTGICRRKCKQLLDDLKKKEILEIERGSTRSHSVENLLRKRLRPVIRLDYIKIILK
jgi:Holliday junction resolvasome RuvABC DNA-binding subunit